MQTSEWNVLIVEDEPDSMEVIQSILGFQGVGCLGASTAEKALQILDVVIPTAIIIDLSLPKMNGWDLLKEIRKNEKLVDVPRVAVTAYHSLELANEAIEAGFNAYFSKPIDATSFVRELQTIVSGY